MIEQGEGSPSREARHLELESAIGRLYAVRRQAQELLDGLWGKTQEEGEKADKEPTPSFATVFHGAAKRIFNLCEEIQKTLTEINSILF